MVSKVIKVVWDVDNNIICCVSAKNNEMKNRIKQIVKKVVWGTESYCGVNSFWFLCKCSS